MSEDTDTVVDELAIRTAIARLARATDLGTIEEYVALFAEDSSIVTPVGTTTGREAIAATASSRRAAGTAGPGSCTRHFITNQVVTLYDDTAMCESAFLYFVETGSSRNLSLIGEYQDNLRRTESGWKVVSRRITFG